MNYNVKGTNLSITDELRTYIEKRLAHCDKFLAHDSTAHADIELEYSEARQGGTHRAEFMVAASGQVYRAERWGSTMHEAIDIVSDELVKELRRTKKKHIRLVRHGASKIKDFVRGFRRDI